MALPTPQSKPTTPTPVVNADSGLVTIPWNSFFVALATPGSALLAKNTPATSAAAGVPGQISYDASFLYVCTAVNTWKRIALVAF
jgi:hypothetical protein